MKNEKEFNLKILEESDTTILILLFTCFFTENTLNTKYRSVNIKRNGKEYFVEQINNYKINKEFIDANKEKLEKIYNKMIEKFKI